jgi:acetyl-CoA C-acetyltransferase
MLTGPVPATKLALKKARMQLSDIDLFEVNEAFAAVPLYYMQALGVDPEKVNVHGGAIALGHPLGATGAVILSTALDIMEERNLSTSLTTLCVGGGMGTATILERI